MKDSEVYLRAAELLVRGHRKWATGGYSCVAISAAQGDLRGIYGCGDEVSHYEAFFMPPNSDFAWGNDWGADAPSCRVLALLFMYQIALDEERTNR